MENYRGWTALLGWIVFGVLLFIQWKDFHLFRTFVDSWNYKNSWNDTIVDGMCEFKTKSRYRKVTIVRACRQSDNTDGKIRSRTGIYSEATSGR